MFSAAMSLPMTSFPNLNSLLVQDDYFKPYLKVADFVRHGESLFFGVVVVCFRLLIDGSHQAHGTRSWCLLCFSVGDFSCSLPSLALDVPMQ